ncbi:energy transducer TonB [Panacibacter ginsenosidivorans]|uniref:Energy transducer TonB n=1 Tax=Panacibacter ginsenosidivorans TaxID=1813871 RepID=A0A5B8VFQ5_9BACT|nr:energy transducer TonB [Panacibacter ginsenosidivorans]QEC69953.1 energy transducer TonB [Panacibacter ginsenosidivorans]
MKSKINLIASTLAAFLIINACQTPEERAAENNAAATTVQATDSSAASMSAPDTASSKTMTDTTTSANSVKAKRGRATVVMVGAHDVKAKMEADKEGVYARAEIMPSYPGGQTALQKFVEDNLQYPEQAIDNGTEGRVVVSFDVDEKGKIYNPVVVSQKLGSGLEEEAMRIVKAMPQWNPGRMKGKNVKTKFSLPIVYQLEQ